jgi:hypothetical protein
MTQTFDSRNAGPRSLVVTGYTISDGNGGANYGVISQNAAGSITPAQLTLAAVADTKVYDSTVASSATPQVVSGLVGGDSVGALIQSFDSRNAGPRTLTVTGYLINDGNGGANYSVATQSAAGSITPAALVLSATAETRVYDGGVASSVAPRVVSGLQGADTVAPMTQVFDSRNAGARTLNLTGYSINDGNAGANYSVTTQSAAGRITPAPLTLAAAADSKVYDGNTSSSALPQVASGLVGGDSVAAMTQAFDSPNAGARSLTVNGYSINDGNAGANYSVVTQAAAGSITPASLTVIADDKTRPQGQPNPPFTASFRGFVAGETALVLGGTLDLASAATPASPPGAYAIVGSGLRSTNYTIAYTDATLSVVAAPFGGGPISAPDFGLALAQRDRWIFGPFATGSRCFATAGESSALGRWTERPVGAADDCRSSGLAGADNR